MPGTTNPFTPAFGGKPQHFFGRTDELDLAKDAILNDNSPYRTIFVTGTRGCGKTALLEQMSLLARNNGWSSIDVHSSHASTAMVRQLAGATEKSTQHTISPQVMGMTAGSTGTSRTRTYDDLDLTELLLERCSSLAGGRGVFVTIDEIQKVAESDMENVCSATQMALRKGMPVVLVLAGLPGSKEKVSSFPGCTFMQRAHDVRLGSLYVDETFEAFGDMLTASGLDAVDDGAIAELAEFSKGYPYLIQLLGYHLVELAQARFGQAVETIDRLLVQEIEPIAYERYRDNVLQPSLRPLGENLMAYLHAMASCMDKDGRVPVRDVSHSLGKEATQLSTYRDRLIKRRLIVPDGYGYLRFNLPHLSRHLLEEQAEVQPTERRCWKF